MLLAEAPCSLLKKRAPRLCKMLIFWTFRASHPSQGAASKTLCFSHVFLAPRRQWGLQCFSQVLWLPKHCVFIGCWLLGGPGNSKTLWFHRLLCLSGALGVPKPYVTSFRAPRVAWGLQTLCVSHVFWLVGGTGVPKPIVFIGVLASRKPWGLENAMEFKSIRALRWT